MRVTYTGLAFVVTLLVITTGAAAWADEAETQAKVLTVPPADMRPARPTVAFTCPMHPQIVQAKPGICPLCRMALKPTKAIGATTTERATNGEMKMDHHEGMSMSAHEDMDGMQMDQGSMGHGMCGCGMCMMMMGMGNMEMANTDNMEEKSHGSAAASATTKPAPQRSYSVGRSGGRGCGC